MAIEISNRCFTFLWKLENISYSLGKKGVRIESPAFVVDALDQTKWKLRFFPRGNTNEDWIAIYLLRESDSKGAPDIKIKYELALLGKDKSELISTGMIENTFSKGIGFGFTEFVKREDVFPTESSIFDQQDTLIARCRIWKSTGQMAVGIRYKARTRIRVQKMASYFTVPNFSALESDKKSTFQVRSLESYETIMNLDLTLTGGSSSFSGGIIRIGFTILDTTVKYCALRLNLISVSGNGVKCNQEEFWFGGSSPGYSYQSSYQSCLPRKEFALSFTKKQLMDMKILYLPNDSLIMHCELALSKGILSSETEEAEYLSLTEPKVRGPIDRPTIHRPPIADSSALLQKWTGGTTSDFGSSAISTFRW